MTFEEWYESAPLVMHPKEAFKAAWNAGFDQGYEQAKFICPARQCQLVWQDERDSK